MKIEKRVEIEITPEMIAAGENVLWEEYGLVGPGTAAEMAVEIFEAMLAQSKEAIAKREEKTAAREEPGELGQIEHR